jgi:UDP-glucose 4-epimerase
MAYYFVSTTSPADTWDDSAREIQEGILRPVRFLETAAEAGVRKVVLPSSGGTVYGRRSGRLTEETPHAPFSPHGIAKCALEHFAGYMRERNGLQVDTYRISNPYGPRQRWDRRQGVVAVWMGQILHGKPLHVYGDDTVERDYIYVGDVAELMMHSLRDLQASGTYNIGSGVGTSIIGLLEAFRRIIPTFFDYTIEPRRAFDNTSAVLDSSKLLSHFPGFEFVHLDEGLRRTWEWFAEKD